MTAGMAAGVEDNSNITLLLEGKGAVEGTACNNLPINTHSATFHK